jgi:hypothetical protein
VWSCTSAPHASSRHDAFPLYILCTETRSFEWLQAKWITEWLNLFTEVNDSFMRDYIQHRSRAGCIPHAHESLTSGDDWQHQWRRRGLKQEHFRLMSEKCSVPNSASNPLPCLRTCMVFFRSSKRRQAQCLRIGHDRFLPNPFNFTECDHPVMSKMAHIKNQKRRYDDNSVSIVARLRADDLGSIPSKGWDSLSSPQRPDWFWDTPNLSNGYRGLFPRR